MDTPQLTPELPDDALLSAASREPGLSERLRRETREAYLAARAIPDCAWERLDNRWNALTNDLRQCAQVSAGSNPNSLRDKEARTAALRATLIVRDHFLECAQAWPKTPKPVSSGLYVARMSGHPFPHPLEAADVPEPEMREAPKLPPGTPMTFTPGQVPKLTPRQYVRRNI